MASKEHDSYFWTSYSDLMTSLFFVMLVLFVLTIALLHQRIVATEGELIQIQRLNKSIEKIDERYFAYDEKYQRHTLKDVAVTFEDRSSNIYDISETDRLRLLDAGRAIRNFLTTAKNDINLKGAQYLLIIEGQSSRDSYQKNYVLSYERALALFRFWETNNITFNDLPCEVIISGSGYNSKFRVKPEFVKINGVTKGNPQNQRFVIHIIPKPGFK